MLELFWAEMALTTRRGALSWTACLGLYIGLAAGGSSAFAIGPSFDCSKARAPMAQFICADPDLSKADLEFVQGYYALRQQVGPDGWQNLKVEAVNFSELAAQQCGVSQSGSLPADKLALRACLMRTYRSQGAAWKSRLGGAALEEVSRPVQQHVASQGRLQALGFLPASEQIDGVYGEATRVAIQNWQQASGLSVTGFLSDSDAIKLTSSSITTDALSAQRPQASPSFEAAPAGLVPMTDLAAIYMRAHQ